MHGLAPLVAPAATTAALRSARARLLALTRRSALMRRTRLVRLALRMGRGAVPLRATLPLISVEGLLLAARRPVVWSRPVRTADTQPLDGHAAADCVADTQPLQHAAVARRLARRNLKGHGADAPTGAARNSKGAGAPRQRAEPAALAVKDLDLSDMAVGIRIELDPRFGRTRGPRAAFFRHIDHAGRAADAERRTRRGDFHIAGLGDEAGDKGGGADQRR